MRREILRGARLLALPTIGVLVILAFVPGRLELAVRVYSLLVSAIILGLGVSALRRSYPHARTLRGPTERRGEHREIPGALARLEGEVALGTAGAFDLHVRLRPRLRQLASDLLAGRRGISLERDPLRARAVLGDETWDLVRDDRPPPGDRLASGIPSAELARIVDSLERL